MNNEKEPVVYIHYGYKKFKKEMFEPISNYGSIFTKPGGGLWASRANASFGWIDWCKREDYRLHKYRRKDNSFSFTLKEGANVVTVSTPEQLRERLPFNKLNWAIEKSVIDFEQCVKNGIDAIELCWFGDEYDNVAEGDMRSELYGWDCDSIVILNPDIIVPIPRRRLRAKMLSN